jgi:hypothetical protein
MSDETTTEEASEPISDLDRAAAKREAAATEAPDPERAFIDALLEERHGYAVYGRDDRVAEVDEQLRLRGVEPPAEASGEGKRTATRGGRGRGRTAQA